MIIRFFILQAHYRSTVDFSNEALLAAEKGLQRLWNALETLNKIESSEKSTLDIKKLEEKCYNAMNDDLNSPILIASLFDGVKMINSIADGKEKISGEDLKKLTGLYNLFVFDILGFKKEVEVKSDNKAYEQVIDLLLNLRIEAKNNKDFITADKIRNELQNLGFTIKDKKDGFEWELKD